MNIKDINSLNNTFALEYDKDKTNNYLKLPKQLLYDDPNKEDEYGAFFEDYEFIEGYYKKYYSGIKLNTRDHFVKTKTSVGGKIYEHEKQCYDPATLKIRKIAKLINKQSRFLFGAEPDINLMLKMDLGEEDKEENTILSVTKEMLDNILDRTSFTSKLFVASKDCAIGKRVAAVINFNIDSGVTIEFLPSLNFVYEYDQVEQDKLKYFAFFKPLVEATTQGVQNIYVKKVYKLDKVGLKQEEIDSVDPNARNFKYRCHVEEIVYDENNRVITKEYQRRNSGVVLFNGYIDLDFIPAQVIINNGLLGDTLGVSDIEDLEEYESWFNTMSDTSIDALRQSMNPMKYTIDMDMKTTSHMSNKPGAYVDLQSDRNAPENKNPNIGILEANLNFADPLNEVLKMINKEMYDFVDVPDIDLETMSGVITSGKALKALYWGLITRCDEKMKTWAPAISNIMHMVLEGCYIYPNIAQRYLGNESFPSKLEFEFEIIRNNPLPEDNIDEKTIALQEVAAQVMSRRTYMVKYLKMNKDEAEAELIQIAMEQNILDNAAIPIDGLTDNTMYNSLMISTTPTMTGTTATEEIIEE